MRTDFVGSVIWCSTVMVGAVPAGSGPPTSAEWFNALIETQYGSKPGDIVAVGEATNGVTGLGRQGYVVRMNGLNGNIGGPLRGATYYGGTQDDAFHGVCEMSIGSDTSDLVFVGESEIAWNMKQATKIYVVKSSEDPCVTRRQMLLGSVTDSTLTEFAMDVKEVTVSGLYNGTVAQGDLVLTGAVQVPASGGPPHNGMEMLLLPIDGDSLWVKGWPTTFGDMWDLMQTACCDGSAFEVGESIQVLGDGFILCGWSEGNLQHYSPGDPRDLYLVRANDSGMTLCETDPDIDTLLVTWPDSCRLPSVDKTVEEWALEPERVSMDTDHEVCDDGERPPCTGCTQPSADAPNTPETSSESATQLRLYPNPVERGELIYGRVFGMGEDVISIEIVDVNGRVVSTQVAHAGDRRIPIVTQGLIPGSYVIVARGQGREASGTIIVAQ